ncbi:MAG: insulinase family protein [Bdellovibrionales bacterium CG10_big_fil_rev_8_21_14_0_10_45_34]|nr:MAG: insulinase family protein [Bdellovibrionales bacterium CG10_big_fil_rev_8_21_14_0_10_45_34]
MVQKFQLKNGLTVVLCESHKSPVVSVQMWVRTGSADELKGEEGISHFIEHLVFKGTNQFGVGEIASIVEGSGGELNAYTSFDQTVFYVTISKQYADTGLNVISQMMGFPKFDSEEIDREREVVIEEIKRSEDSPGRQASRGMFETVFKGHPYSIPVIGYSENVKKFSPKKIREFFESRYNPENMFLVVCGDFENDDMRARVDRHFSTHAKRKLRHSVRNKAPRQKKPRLFLRQSEFEENFVQISFPIPGVKETDVPALDLMALVLGQGESSRLVSKVRNELNLATTIGCYAYTPKDSGVFSISISYRETNIGNLLSAVGEQLLLMRELPVELEELERSLSILEGEELYSIETVDGLSSKVGNYEFHFDDPAYFETYLRQLQSVTRKDILRVSKKYIDPTGMSVTALVKSDLKEIDYELKKFVNDFTLAIDSLNTLAAEEAPERSVNRRPLGFQVGKSEDSTPELVRLACNVDVLLRPNHDAPSVSMKLASLGGARAESAEKLGLTQLASSVWPASTSNFTEQRLSHETEKLAASIRGFAGRNSMGLGVDMLAPHSAEVWALLEEIVGNFRIQPEIFEREKSHQLDHILSKKDNPAQICIQNFYDLIFSGHPYGREPEGDIETLKNITERDIESCAREHLGRGRLKISISGSFEKEETLKRIEKLVKPLKNYEHDLFVSVPLAQLIANKKVYVQQKKEQSHIVVGCRGLSFKSEDRFALLLIQSILAGQGGRLFLNLRDKASLAYTVSPLKMEGVEGGYFGVYIGCSPEKAKLAISMIHSELQRLVDDMVPSLELERSQKYLIGRHDIDLQRNSAIASSMLFDHIYGVPFNQYLNFSENIKKITAHEIKDLAQKLFTQSFVEVCVGQQNPFGSDAIEREISEKSSVASAR